VLNEVVRSNTIMSDLSDTLEILLSPEGMDYSMLSEVEKANNDISAHSFTDRDKKVLRQFEGVATPAKVFCMYLQNNHPSCWAYQTFELRLTLQDTGADTIPIYPDISRTDRVKDLRNRGDKTILVKKSGVEVNAETAKNYDKVKLMDPMVETYCNLYVEDLAKRVGLSDTYLSPLLTTHVLLNPMFGLRSRIINTGLLTAEQYSRGKMSKLLIFMYCSLYATTFFTCIP